MSQITGFAVVWRDPVVSGSIDIYHGKLGQIWTPDRKSPTGNQFQFGPNQIPRLEVSVLEPQIDHGAFATRVTVHSPPHPSFSFFLRDVTRDTPLLIPDLSVAVVPIDDTRDYTAIDTAVRGKNLVSDAQRIESESEETYELACARTRDQDSPTWLGLGRDVRIFHVHHWMRYQAALPFGYWGQIEPWNHSGARDAPDQPHHVMYIFSLGRGSMCTVDLERRLEDGVLPILQSVQRDAEIEYNVVMFATLESGPLTADTTVRGTHYVAAFANTGGHMLTEAESKLYNDTLIQTEIRNREEEVVCWMRATAVNRGAVPRYAYFQTAYPTGPGVADYKTSFDSATGSRTMEKDGKVMCAALIDGKPMPQSEMAILLQPGASATFDLLVPHRPIARDRAERLVTQKFDSHRAGCRAYWQAKLDRGASISVPEPAVDERIRAGLLHLDLATLGLEKEGPLLATVGWYSPIGSESSPIIQFYDSMGWHTVAERCIQFFLDRQRDDGFIQTFGGYQLETGPTLWTIGEHYRYTRDAEWARRVQSRVFKACDYILKWRDRNKREELRGKGYGLIDGKVADPQDFFHSFMLNGLAYVGLKRIAEMYRTIDPQAAEKLETESKAYLKDIRNAYLESVARSPAVPLGDGTWVPSFPPWSEYPGPVSLYAEGGDWNTHGVFGGRDSLIGALYLVMGEVIDANEPAAGWMLHAHQELMTYRNAGMSQPYYCRHDWVHLKRGEVKQFLKTYYNQFASLQDRQTYTFWEHYFGASQHKTHEEGWFLMQTRWMLWHEEGDTLVLLSMIPRRWLTDGKSITLKNCVSHFGRFDLSVTSRLVDGGIEARLSLEPGRLPKRVTIRLPHPDQKKAVTALGGQYDEHREHVLVEQFTGTAEISLRF